MTPTEQAREVLRRNLAIMERERKHMLYVPLTKLHVEALLTLRDDVEVNELVCKGIDEALAGDDL